MIKLLLVVLTCITHLFCVFTYTYAPFVRFFAKNPHSKECGFFYPSHRLDVSVFLFKLVLRLWKLPTKRGCKQS